MSDSELACVYASLILHDDGIEISSDKIQKLIDAAGVEVEPIWSSLFAKALQGKDLSSFFMNIGSAPSAGAAAPAAASGAAPAAAKVEEAPKEEEEEEDEDMGFGLFD